MILEIKKQFGIEPFKYCTLLLLHTPFVLRYAPPLLELDIIFYPLTQFYTLAGARISIYFPIAVGQLKKGFTGALLKQAKNNVHA